ncbi:MAG TPA: GNAT family N-acetyltransferase [Propionibacterium sp.]|nr:GNAT family N-acetyltransferase [Propionibacterium sp.]
MVTHGVRLRPLEPGDAEVMAAWGDDLLFCDEAGWSRDLAPAERRVRWAELVADLPPGIVRLAGVAGDEVVGYVDLRGTEPGRRELGYLVGGRERWGRGLGTALARAGLEHAFTVLRLAEVWAEAADANPASVRILQRIGMTETGRGDATWFLDRPTFHRQFAITAEEWRARRPGIRDASGPAATPAW